MTPSNTLSPRKESGWRHVFALRVRTCFAFLPSLSARLFVSSWTSPVLPHDGIPPAPSHPPPYPVPSTDDDPPTKPPRLFPSRTTPPAEQHVAVSGAGSVERVHASGASGGSRQREGTADLGVQHIARVDEADSELGGPRQRTVRTWPLPLLPARMYILMYTTSQEGGRQNACICMRYVRG